MCHNLNTCKVYFPHVGKKYDISNHLLWKNLHHNFGNFKVSFLRILQKYASSKNLFGKKLESQSFMKHSDSKFNIIFCACNAFAQPMRLQGFSFLFVSVLLFQCTTETGFWHREPKPRYRYRSWNSMCPNLSFFSIFLINKFWKAWNWVLVSDLNQNSGFGRTLYCSHHL